MKIVAEDKLVEERTAELLQEWERKKPIHVSEEFQKGLINTVHVHAAGKLMYILYI